MFISCLVDKQTANIYTMERYSAIKRNELLVHAIAWIIPSKISQTQKATPSCKIPFIWHSRKGTTSGTEIRSLVARGWEGDKRTDKKEAQRTFWSDKNILHLNCGDGGCYEFAFTKAYRTVHLKGVHVTMCKSYFKKLKIERGY